MILAKGFAKHSAMTRLNTKESIAAFAERESLVMYYTDNEKKETASNLYQTLGDESTSKPIL